MKPPSAGAGATDAGGDKPAAWLNWDAVQRVRVAAETALSTAKTKAEKLKLTRDVTVLRLLADQPPDRVGVVRSLKLGGTLKRKPDGQYELDLGEPGAHKTSAVFGATRTSVNDSITPWLDRYITLADRSKMQASATYDKGASDRRVSAAMKVAADYSAKFSSNATASTASSSTDKP